MQLKAIYNHGRLEFKQPVHFIRDHFEITVDIPDQEVSTIKHTDSEASLKTVQTRIGASLDAIVGKKFRQANSGMKSIDCKAIWHEHLEEKYFG